MREFLRELGRNFQLSRTAAELEALVGTSEFLTLVKEGILVPAGLSDGVPCAIDARRPCKRRVAPVPMGARMPVLAVCERPVDMCESTWVQEAELQIYELSRTKFRNVLARVFAAHGEVSEPAPLATALSIGRTDKRDVFFCYDPYDRGFDEWVERTPVTVLVTRRSLVDAGTDRDYIKKRGEILFLEDEICAGENRRIVRARYGVPIESEEGVGALGELTQEEASSSTLPPPVVEPEPETVRVPEPAPLDLRLPIVHGLQWSEVEVFVLHDDVVSIRLRNEAPVRCGPADLKLADERTRAGTAAWRLLVDLCAGRGECSMRDVNVSSVDTFRKRAASLNQALSAATRVPGSAVSVSLRSGVASARFRAFPSPPYDEDRLPL